MINWKKIIDVGGEMQEGRRKETQEDERAKAKDIL